MKIRVKLSGEVYYADYWENCDVRIDEDDRPKDIDWDAFRREAAKDIMCAMICAPGPYMKSLQEAVHDAIKQANELIKQLKEKEQC